MPQPSLAPAYDAVVLAGGTARRFGSDKTAALMDGVPLLVHVLAAVSSAGRRIVVGEPRPVGCEVIWTREQPPGSGPAAGVVAGLARVRAPWTVLLAGDLPFVDAGTVRRLLDTGDGGVLIDAEGRRQHLSIAVRTGLLRERAAGRDWADESMRTLLAGLPLTEVPARGAESSDVDVPGDLPGPGGGAMDLQEWTAAVQAAVGSEAAIDIDLVLDVARDAAHAVERPAAPLTTFLLGYAAAQRGGSEADVSEVAAVITRLCAEHADGEG